MLLEVVPDEVKGAGVSEDVVLLEEACGAEGVAVGGIVSA